MKAPTLSAHLRDGARWLKWFAGEHERAQRVAGHVDEAAALLERYEVCGPRPHHFVRRLRDDGSCAVCGATFQHPLHDDPNGTALPVPAGAGEATEAPHRQALSVGVPADGVALIAAERRRQVEVEGWTADHDDEHEAWELAVAAAELALYGTGVDIALGAYEPDMCGSVAKHAGDRVRQLVIAGALIAAEIDRLQRAGREP